MTPIYRDTRIGTIIKSNKDSIEAIAGVAKVFEKLRNPLLRKVLAPRTTLEDAARIAGCSVEDIARKLEPLGFTLVKRPLPGEKIADKTPAGIPDFIRGLTPEREHILDVRADLQTGNDPLKKILQEVNGLAPGEVLRIINSFEPAPLISLLAKKGFENHVEHLSSGEVHTYFYLRNVNRNIQNVNIEKESPKQVTETVLREKMAGFGDRIRKVDVRDMEMPMPMITILESLADLPGGHALWVTHKRIPVFLFPELKERGYHWLICKSETTGIQLLIFSQAS